MRYIDQILLGRKESQLQDLLRKLDTFKNMSVRPAEVQKLLSSVNKAKREYVVAAQTYNQNYHENFVPKTDLVRLSSYGYGRSSEDAEAFDGTDISALRKQTPGVLTSRIPPLNDLGESRDFNFVEVTAFATQTAFELNLLDEAKEDPAKPGKTIVEKGIDSFLLSGEIIGSDLRRKINGSVNDTLEGYGYTTGDPAINETIETELITLSYWRSREFLINELDKSMKNPTGPGLRPEANEETKLAVIVIHLAPGPLGPNPTRAQRAAFNQAQALHDTAVANQAARDSQLRELGFPIPPPATLTLGQIADRVSQETFDLKSPQGQRFLNSAPPEQKDQLEKIIGSAQLTRHDVNTRKIWTDNYHRELKSGTRGADIRTVSVEYKHFQERKKTLSRTGDSSSINALLAAGSASQSVITSPAGQLDSNVITSRVGQTLESAGREGETPATVTTRANDTKSVVDPILTAVKDDTKGTPADNSVLAGRMARQVTLNILNDQKADAKLSAINEVKDLETKDAKGLEDHFSVKIKKRYADDLKTNDPQKGEKARTEMAILTSLGATVYAVAIKEGVSEAKAKTLAERLASHKVSDLTHTSLSGIIEKDAKEIKGISTPIQKKLIEAAQTSFATSKGLVAQKYEARRQAREELKNEAAKVLPPNLALKLAEEADRQYDETTGELKFNACANTVIDHANQAGYFIQNIVNTTGDLKLEPGEKKQLGDALFNKYFETGKLDKAFIKETIKSLDSDQKGVNAFYTALLDEKGELKGPFARRHDFGFMPDDRKAELKQFAEQTFAKIPQNRIALSVSAAAEAAGFDPAKAKAVGQSVAEDKITTTNAMIEALPSTDPVVKTSVFSSLELNDEKIRERAIRKSYALSAQNNRKTTVALAMASAAKSTVLSSADPAVRAYADGVSQDLITHGQGYLNLQERLNYDACIDNGRGAPVIPAVFKAEIKQNVKAAHAIAIGKIAGKEAVDKHQTTMTTNQNLKNVREVASVSAAASLNEGLSEDLSLEIGSQLAQYYVSNNGVLDEKTVSGLIDSAAVKYPPGAAITDTQKTTIFRSTQAAARLTPTQRGTAHGGTTAATSAIPALPQTADDKAQSKVKAVTVAYLCASGDNPDQNTVEIGNSIGVTLSGLEASEQQAQSEGAGAAAAIEASASIYRQINNHGVIIANLGTAGHASLIQIGNDITAALDAAKPGIDVNQRTAIAETAKSAIQKEASRGGATNDSIAIAGSIAASTTASALEANVHINDSKLLGQAFAKLPDRDYPPETLADIMEISYASARANESTTLTEALKNNLSAKDRNFINDLTPAGFEAKIRAEVTNGLTLTVPPPGEPAGIHYRNPKRYLLTALADHTGAPSGKTLKNVNECALSIINGAAKNAHALLPKIPLAAEPLFAALESKAANEAAFRIACMPNVPPATLKLVRDRANYYADRAHQALEGARTQGLRPAVAPKLVRNLAKTAGVSGYAMAKGIIAGRASSTRGEDKTLQAKAAAKESASIMGAKPSDAESAGEEAKRASEQKNSPREVGALVGIKLAEKGRPDVAKPTAAVATYFTTPDDKNIAERSQGIGQSVGASTSHDRRVLADGAGLDDYNSDTLGTKKKLLQSYTDPDRLQVRKKVQDAVVKAKPEHPAPAPTSMANDPVLNEVIEIDSLGSATIKRWDPKQKMLVEERLEDLPEFQEVMAELKTCQKDGVSFLTTQVFRDAAKEFNAKFKPSDPIDPNKIVKNSQTGKHWIPLKNLNDDQTKEYLKIVAAKAKFNMAHNKTISPTLSGGLRK